MPRSGAQQTPRAVGLIENPTKKKGTKTQFENTSGKYSDTQVKWIIKSKLEKIKAETSKKNVLIITIPHFNGIIAGAGYEEGLTGEEVQGRGSRVVGIAHHRDLTGFETKGKEINGDRQGSRRKRKSKSTRISCSSL